MAELYPTNVHPRVKIPVSNGVLGSLRPGESISDGVNLTDTTTAFTLRRNGLYPGDGVLLEITGPTEPDVLIGGNLLKLTAEVGIVDVMTLDLSSGHRHRKRIYGDTHLDGKLWMPTDELYLASKTTIDPKEGPVAYWYAPDPALGRCVVRDECREFDPANEVPALDVLQAILNSRPYMEWGQSEVVR